MPKLFTISSSLLRNPLLKILRNNFGLCKFQKFAGVHRKCPRPAGVFLSFLGQCFGTAYTLFGITKISALPGFFQSNKDSYNSPYDVEKIITDMVLKAEEMIVKNDLIGAKQILKDALKIAEQTNVYGNVSSVYDLLTVIALREGGITEVEDLLANFIDKLLQLGYPEDHNSVIRFKLKLARLYQTIGNKELAELGYRDCISAQEKKIRSAKVNDDNTLLLYVNSLFWYGKLLTENGEFSKARKYMKQTLKEMQNCTQIATSQIMVVLYHNAELATIHKEYDEALDFLFKAIDLCNSLDRDNTDLPFYIVKVGEIFLLKGIYENAEFWCNNAKKISTSIKNLDAEKEASECLRKLDELKKVSTMKDKEKKPNKKK